MTIQPYFPKGFEEPPFGTPLIWGKKGSGKTLAGLNSPWGPVHTIDVEDSSLDYFKNIDKLITLGTLHYPFTRTQCYSAEQFGEEIKRMEMDKLMFGTIMLDTAGQIAEWAKSIFFGIAEKKVGPSGKSQAETQSQIVWGKVRDKLRTNLITLKAHAKLVILTAHETEYPKDHFNPRCNPALAELAAMSIRLVRNPNELLPTGQIFSSRLPYFDPLIPKFSLVKLLNFFDKPADYDNLKADQRIPEDIPATEEKLTDEQQEQLNG
jgi:hypothetical protein